MKRMLAISFCVFSSCFLHAIEPVSTAIGALLLGKCSVKVVCGAWSWWNKKDAKNDLVSRSVLEEKVKEVESLRKQIVDAKKELEVVQQRLQEKDFHEKTLEREKGVLEEQYRKQIESMSAKEKKISVAIMEKINEFYEESKS